MENSLYARTCGSLGYVKSTLYEAKHLVKLDYSGYPLCLAITFNEDRSEFEGHIIIHSVAKEDIEKIFSELERLGFTEVRLFKEVKSNEVHNNE